MPSLSSTTVGDAPMPVALRHTTTSTATATTAAAAKPAPMSLHFQYRSARRNGPTGIPQASARTVIATGAGDVPTPRPTTIAPRGDALERQSLGTVVLATGGMDRESRLQPHPNHQTVGLSTGNNALPLGPYAGAVPSAAAPAAGGDGAPAARQRLVAASQALEIQHLQDLLRRRDRELQDVVARSSAAADAYERNARQLEETNHALASDVTLLGERLRDVEGRAAEAKAFADAAAAGDERWVAEGRPDPHSLAEHLRAELQRVRTEHRAEAQEKNLLLNKLVAERDRCAALESRNAQQAAEVNALQSKLEDTEVLLSRYVNQHHHQNQNHQSHHRSLSNARGGWQQLSALRRLAGDGGEDGRDGDEAPYPYPVTTSTQTSTALQEEYWLEEDPTECNNAAAAAEDNNRRQHQPPQTRTRALQYHAGLEQQLAEYHDRCRAAHARNGERVALALRTCLEAELTRLAAQQAAVQEQLNGANAAPPMLLAGPPMNAHAYPGNTGIRSQSHAATVSIAASASASAAVSRTGSIASERPAATAKISGGYITSPARPQGDRHAGYSHVPHPYGRSVSDSAPPSREPSVDPRAGPAPAPMPPSPRATHVGTDGRARTPPPSSSYARQPMHHSQPVMHPPPPPPSQTLPSQPPAHEAQMAALRERLRTLQREHAEATTSAMARPYPPGSVAIITDMHGTPVLPTVPAGVGSSGGHAEAERVDAYHALFSRGARVADNDVYLRPVKEEGTKPSQQSQLHGQHPPQQGPFHDGGATNRSAAGGGYTADKEHAAMTTPRQTHTGPPRRAPVEREAIERTPATTASHNHSYHVLSPRTLRADALSAYDAAGTSPQGKDFSDDPNDEEEDDLPVVSRSAAAGLMRSLPPSSPSAAASAPNQPHSRHGTATVSHAGGPLDAPDRRFAPTAAAAAPASHNRSSGRNNGADRGGGIGSGPATAFQTLLAAADPLPSAPARHEHVKKMTSGGGRSAAKAPEEEQKPARRRTNLL